MKGLSNQVMDSIKLFFRSSLSFVRPSDIDVGYTLTIPECGLRRFLSDSMAYRTVRMECGQLSYPTMGLLVQSLLEIDDFARDFVFAQNKFQMHNFLMVPFLMLDCTYHDHEHTTNCLLQNS